MIEDKSQPELNEEFGRDLIELEYGENRKAFATAKKRKIWAAIVFLIMFFAALAVMSKYGFSSDAVTELIFVASVGLISIIFSKRLGSLKGFVALEGSGTYIDKISPPAVVEFLGWTLLLIPIAIFLLSFLLSK